MFAKFPDERTWFILQGKAGMNEKAEECLVNCPFCRKMFYERKHDNGRQRFDRTCNHEE